MTLRRRRRLEHAEGLDIQLGERVIVDGEDVTDAIRTPEVSEAASKIATNQKVRAALVLKQRELLADGDWVAEGRDIGTVVAPDAAVKVFLTARPRSAPGGEPPSSARTSTPCCATRPCATLRTRAASTRRSAGPPRTPWSSTPPACARRGGRAHRALVEETRDAVRRAKVAVVGYPNVGKSTLVNRLSGTREAVVHEQAGVTRDRKEVEADWNGRGFTLVDTGGVDLAEASTRWPRRSAPGPRGARRRRPGRARRRRPGGLRPATPSWLASCAAARCRSSWPPTRSTRSPRPGSRPSSTLGLGDPVAVSATQGLGTGDLLDVIVERLPRDHDERADETTRLAVIGRPQRRQVVAGQPAAGRGARDRRRPARAPRATRSTPASRSRAPGWCWSTPPGSAAARRSRARSDYYAQLRSERPPSAPQVAIVVCDAAEGVTSEDFRIAEMAMKKKCATVIALNKWDVDEHRPRGRQGARRPEAAPAPAGDGGVGQDGARLKRLVAEAMSLADRSSQWIQTPELNRFLGDLQASRQPPAMRGKRLRMYYMAQYETGPPRFAVQVNDRGLVTRDYAYFLENRLRERYGLEGVPLVIDFKTSLGPFGLSRLPWAILYPSRLL